MKMENQGSMDEAFRKLSIEQSKKDGRYMPKKRDVFAFQMTRERRWNNSEWPEWLNEAWNKDPITTGGVWMESDVDDKECLVCGTLEGVHKIAFDDWIIQGAKGDILVCAPDLFEQLYEYSDSTTSYRIAIGLEEGK
jgi:hypothetical protein